LENFLIQKYQRDSNPQSSVFEADEMTTMPLLFNIFFCKKKTPNKKWPHSLSQCSHFHV
jgi:hypothetical protein